VSLWDPLSAFLSRNSLLWESEWPLREKNSSFSFPKKRDAFLSVHRTCSIEKLSIIAATIFEWDPFESGASSHIIPTKVKVKEDLAKVFLEVDALACKERDVMLSSLL